MIHENWKELEDWFDGQFRLFEDHIRGNKARWEIKIDKNTVVNILTEGDICGIIYPQIERNYFEVGICYKIEENNNLIHYTLLCVPYHVVLEIIEGLRQDIVKDVIK